MIRYLSGLFKKDSFFYLFVAAVFSLAAGANGYEKFHGHDHESSTKLNYDSLLSAATVVGQSAQGQQIIEECIQAYGGLERLRTLKSLRLHWRMLSLMTEDSIDVIRIRTADRRYKIVLERPQGSESRLINGEKAWFQTDDTLIFLDDGRYKAELFSYLVLSMPLAMKTERFDDIRYGQRTDDSLHYIYMDKHDSLLIIIGIDPHNFLIKKAEGIIRQDGAPFVFINHFDDYREEAGYLFPHSLTNISMGLTVGRSRLQDVMVNFEAAESDFLPAGLIGD